MAFATPWTLPSPCPDALARSGLQADCRRVSTHAHPAKGGTAWLGVRSPHHAAGPSPNLAVSIRRVSPPEPCFTRKPLLCPTELPGPKVPRRYRITTLLTTRSAAPPICLLHKKQVAWARKELHPHLQARARSISAPERRGPVGTEGFGCGQRRIASVDSPAAAPGRSGSAH